MTERNKHSYAGWRSIGAATCFVGAVLSLVGGFVLTTRWILDSQLHPLLYGFGIVLLILGLPILILGGHFMDLNERKSRESKSQMKGHQVLHILVGFSALLSILFLSSIDTNAQPNRLKPAGINFDFEKSFFDGLVEKPVTAEKEEAQPSSRKWQYGGFVDLAYPLNFKHPANHLFRSRGTAFRTDSVWLNMASVYLRKRPSPDSRWGVELTAQVGKDDEFFGFSATAPNIAGNKFLRHFGPTNVSYLAPVGNGLTLQAGIFSSLIGYDSLYAKDNFNYTRPWGADFTPYFMTGANASYPFTEKLTGTFFLVNGYWHLARANSAPSAGGQIAYKMTHNWTLKETTLFGPHQRNTGFEFWRFLTDTIVERKTEKFTIASDYIFSTEKVDAPGKPRALMMSWQLPMRWTLNDRWSVALRPEVFWDRDGRWTLARQTVKALTSTVEYRIPHKWTNTIFRLEHRFDDSRGADGGFFRGAELASGVVAPTPRQHLLIFATILTLDSPAPN